MKIAIKLGGTLLEDQASRDALARQLSAVSSRFELIVVHGGGKQVTRFLEERDVESRFVGGLRVSDEAVIDAVTKVIAGGINKQLVAALVAAGARPVGISGLDGPLTTATLLNPDLGLVGKPGKTDGHLLTLLVKGGYLPVVACIAGDLDGQIYNVNADQMAVSCAAGWGAEKLFFLTDVQGVKDSYGQIVRRLSVTASQALIDAGVAHGGMQAKLESARLALQSGVGEVVIASGREKEVCVRLLEENTIGTSLTIEEVHA